MGADAKTQPAGGLGKPLAINKNYKGYVNSSNAAAFSRSVRRLERVEA